MNRTNCLLLCLAFVALTSCADDSFFSKVHDMPSNYWTMGDKASFSFQIEDTTNKYDIVADLRSNDGYPWSNIFIYSTTEDTLDYVHKDTLKCVLCDDLGHPTGSGLSNVKENVIIVKKDFVFPHSGKWTISFSHGMRNVELQGVCSIGLRILKKDK
ncbi:MAG: gliding motility lipoprotein GldH [Flavobacteriales bacterium]|nr:gliding motility lipoprotein GldH [Flavobacteriales bacterium]